MGKFKSLHPRSIFKIPNLYAPRIGSLRHLEVVEFVGVPTVTFDYEWRELSTGGWVAYSSNYSKEVFFEEVE